MIRFTADQHKYRSIDPEDTTDWIGVTTLVSSFKPKFNAKEKSLKASNNPKSPWYGIPQEQILKIWKGESDRSLSAGKWYHSREEDKILSSPVFQKDEDFLKVVKPIHIGEDKYAPVQVLENNSIYPEHFMYLRSEGICGQSDKVEVYNLKVNVTDYKTSKVIKTEGFKNWEGITEKMLPPLSHLDNCHLVHYSLQESLYLYMILKHNPQFSPGVLTLDHIIFEIDYLDKYGYPVHKLTLDGSYIIKEIKSYNIPYLKTEVLSIISYLKDNRPLIKQINATQDI